MSEKDILTKQWLTFIELDYRLTCIVYTRTMIRLRKNNFLF
jgi:hypothetical protein